MRENQRLWVQYYKVVAKLQEKKKQFNEALESLKRASVIIQEILPNKLTHAEIQIQKAQIYHANVFHLDVDEVDEMKEMVNNIGNSRLSKQVEDLGF